MGSCNVDACRRVYHLFIPNFLRNAYMLKGVNNTFQQLPEILAGMLELSEKVCFSFVMTIVRFKSLSCKT